jgi:hypothetical protein
MVPTQVSGKSLQFEALAGELQRPAVLGDCAHNAIWSARWNLRLNFKSHGDLRAHQASEVRDDFVSDATGIPADAGRLQRYCAVETFRQASRDSLCNAGWIGTCFPRLRRWSGSRPERGLGLLLLQRYVRLDKKTLHVVEGVGDWRPATQTAIATSHLVVTVGISKGLPAPEQKSQTVPDGRR